MILSSSAYAVWQYMYGQQTAVSPSEQFKNANEVFQGTLWTGSTNSGSMMMGNGPMMRLGSYVDGSYTGSTEDAYYGMVQVKVVVTNGRITDVQFLQHPSSHENSIFINGRAMPLLTREALQVQSAQVDGVSGATFTTGAFKQSLATALAQAN